MTMMRIPADCVSLFDYERYFHERVDPAIRAWIAGAAADGITQRENRGAFDRVQIVPRVLVDLSLASARTTLFGQTLDYPVLIGPGAWHRLVCKAGERATVQAASLTRTWMTVSTQASETLEAIAQDATSPLWFQLYMQPRWSDTLNLARRAENAGYRALVVTVDAPVNGIRNAEQRAGFRLPPGIESVNLRGFAPAPASGASGHAGSPVFQGLLAGAPTWADIERLARETSLPVLLKGVLNPADVAPALDAGAAGIIVSNHGGRTLDTVPATLDALPPIAAAVRGRVPVLLDGAVRRGTDVLKALALGAQAVLLGQPVLHALAVGGVAGLVHMLTIMQTELEAAMALAGVPNLANVPRETVRVVTS